MPDNLLCELNAATVEGLARIDQVILRHFNIPSLYVIAPRYYHPPPSEPEEWKDIGAVIRDKKGDCKDFVAWRLAELWESGVLARAESVVSRKGKRTMKFHTFIRYPDGRVEDPARKLGMP